MEPTLRKPLGVLAIIAGLIVYAGLVAQFAEPLGRLPALVQTAVYLILGFVWLLPIKPVLRWMSPPR